jgi:hypothetical protein
MLRSFRAEEPCLRPQSESGSPSSHPRSWCNRASIPGLSDPWTPESTAAKDKPGRCPSADPHDERTPSGAERADLRDGDGAGERHRKQIRSRRGVDDGQVVAQGQVDAEPVRRESETR